MPTRKDALMMQIMLAFAQGCDGMDLEEDAGAWFHGRYYDWIERPSAKAGGTSPLDVWGERGQDFRGRFRKIGELAAGASSGTIQADTLEKSALTVEGGSDCPWCPDL
jgi:hypothetical protein